MGRSFKTDINAIKDVLTTDSPITSKVIGVADVLSDDTPTMSEINAENETQSDISQQTPSTATATAEPNSTATDVGESADLNYSESKETAQVDNLFGAPSMFNKTALFVHPSSNDSNGFKSFKDIQGQSKIYSSTVPTVREIIDRFKDDPAKRLHFADFAWAKWYDYIPNNRLIVLRRFPFPTYNNLQFGGTENKKSASKQIKVLSKAITYFGEDTGNDISDIVKIMGYKNYKDLTAELDIIQGKDKGLDDSPFAGVSGKTNKWSKIFSALSGRGDLDQSEKDRINKLLNKNWENDRKGAENVIHKTMIADVGVGATLEFSLLFEYKLRSRNNINPRVAILDLLSNLLTLVHTNASFWGGQNVILPNSQQFPFIGDQDKFYSGNYGEYISSVVDSFKEPFQTGGAFQGLIDGIMSGDLSSLGNFLKNIGGKALDIQSAKSRESVYGLKTLLDSAPVGKYHMSVGNPFQPWFQVGNLIVPTFEITVGNTLGWNDVPTDIKLKVDLKTATPLDSTGVQGLFSGGISNRMYHRSKDFFNADQASMSGIQYSKLDIQRALGVIY